jgi:phosphocarrier protein
VLLLCGAKGTIVEVVADGPEADEAVSSIGTLIAERFGEDE